MALSWAPGDGYGSLGDTEVGREYTYGEVTVKGVRQLAAAMFFIPATRPGFSTDGVTTVQEVDVIFYDLGSGVGRLAAQIFLDHRSVTKSVGVELSAARHAIAGAALARLSLLTDIAGRIEYIHDNILTTDFGTATHIYISSLCFPEAVLNALADRICNNAAPNLRVIAALSQINGLQDLGWVVGYVDIEMSWGSQRVRIYTRQSRELPPMTTNGVSK